MVREGFALPDFTWPNLDLYMLNRGINSRRLWNAAAKGWLPLRPLGRSAERKRGDEGFSAACSALVGTPHPAFGHLLPKGRSGSVLRRPSFFAVVVLRR